MSRAAASAPEAWHRCRTPIHKMKKPCLGRHRRKMSLLLAAPNEMKAGRSWKFLALGFYNDGAPTALWKSQFNARPHPGLLPGEKEKRAPPQNKPATGLAGRGGERGKIFSIYSLSWGRGLG